jgi:phosphoserine phosphatase RsbU/P
MKMKKKNPKQAEPVDRIQQKIAKETALTDLVASEVLQRVQDWFAQSERISVTVRDPSGERVTHPNYQTNFGRMVMESEAGEAACVEAYKKAFARAAKTRKLVRYVARCHLLQFAAPIFVEDVCVGCLVMGGRPEKPLSERTLTRLAKTTGIMKEALVLSANEAALWQEDELYHAQAFVQSVARTTEWLCIQGARLRGKIRELESIFEISRMLASTLDLRKVLKLVAKSAVDILAAKGCSIRLLGPQKRQLDIKSYYNLSRRYMNKGIVKIEDCPIDRAALDGKIVQMPDLANDPRVLYRKEAKREGIGSGVSVGLVSKSRPVGTLHIYRTERGELGEDQLQLLAALANHAAVAIANAQMHQETQAKRRMERELRLAGDIQSQLLPAKAPNLPGLDIATASIPCSEVGGDFYDFVPLHDGKFAFIIADVAGKGVPAALLMATARAGIRAYLERTTCPREAVSRINLALCHDTQAGQFCSLFCGIYDPDTRMLRYTNAGHNPPILIRNGKIEEMEEGGLVLAADEDEIYEEGQVGLETGDIVVFYTDGVTEALSGDRELFGVEQFEKLLKRNARHSAETIVNRTQAAVKRHAKGIGQSDDITMVVVRVT